MWCTVLKEVIFVEFNFRFRLSNTTTCVTKGGGVLSAKDPTGTCHKHRQKNQPPGKSMINYYIKYLVYEWVDFSKLSKIWAKTGKSLRKFEKKTRRFSNHESRLLSRSHTFAIIVIFNKFENTSKYVDTLTLFSKNLNQRSLTPRWPLTPCLLRSHVWLYPRIIVSKSHDDTSMYVDTVINFANYHIHTYTYYVHTTYILHTTYRMSDHIVSYWTQFRRDKNEKMW